MRKRISFPIPFFFQIFLAAVVLVLSLAGGLNGAALDERGPEGPCLSGCSGRDRAVGHDPSYVDRLVEQAQRARLDQDPYWHTLLHYRQGRTGFRSLVDDPRFFVSPRGKVDPRAELEGTIRAFFGPAATEGKHPVCRFVARYYWLKEKLNLDPSALSVKECEHLARLVDAMQPESTTLVFAASHINSPASMFGHTFITYETASGSKLLAYAVNYSAVTPETFGPLFAVKGLFGLYKGYFSVLPYYTKLQEYNDIDHRDMWEYPLNFSREETIRSIMHVYELDNIYSDYYFFDENCSYNLLFLLEAGRPSLNLTDSATPWVIPLDTIRTAEAAGIVTGTAYRPSKTTRIRHIAARLDTQQRLLALDVARGSVRPDTIAAGEGSREAKIETCDLAVEYLQYLYSTRTITKEAYTERFVRLLSVRSALGTRQGGEYAVAAPPKPEEGHLSNRISPGFGVKNRKAFQELRFRPAYHTLTDYTRGYPEGSHIVFADTTVRYYFDERKFRLEQLDFVDIISIAPRDELFKPISWKVKAGLTQRVMPDHSDSMVFDLCPGGGFSWRVHPLGLFYVMFETDLNAGSAFRDNYALGGGGTVGMLAAVTDRWKMGFSVRDIYYGFGTKEHNVLNVSLSQNYAIGTNVGVSLDVSRNKTGDFYWTEGRVSLNLFF